MQYTLSLYDTCQRKETPILPSDTKSIRMYTCGPTIYDFAHIGNFRTFLFEDLLRRTLKLFGYQVTQVMNLTDVDDKTIKGSKTKGISLQEYTSQFEKAFFQDLKTLRIDPVEHYPRATDYIPKMIEFIEGLLHKKMAYVGQDQSVYFSIAKMKDYGKLSHLNMEDLKTDMSARVRNDEYEKEALSDFVLWKSFDPERDGSVFWESPWGKGRPGWHLECSVMARALLGDTIDLHAGGVDLIFPHHENEIAQSESLTGKPFSLHWAHAEHLLVDHKKMSKSLGNFYTLRDLLDKGFLPTTIRLFLLGTHYRTPLNFTLDALSGTASSVKRIRDFAGRLHEETDVKAPSCQAMIEHHRDLFKKALAKDLNINEALAALFDFIRISNALLDKKEMSQEDTKKALSFMNEVDQVLSILQPEEEAIPQEILNLLDERKEARAKKDFQKSDLLRKELLSKGFLIEDSQSGQKISRVQTCLKK